MTNRCPHCHSEQVESVNDIPTVVTSRCHHSTGGLSLELSAAKELPWRGFMGILILIGVWQTIAAYICTHLLHLTPATTDTIRQLIAGAFLFFGCCGAYQTVLNRRAAHSEAKQNKSWICRHCGQQFDAK